MLKIAKNYAKILPKFFTHPNMIIYMSIESPIQIRCCFKKQYKTGRGYLVRKKASCFVSSFFGTEITNLMPILAHRFD
jgi:hypothetical protein